MIKAIALVVYLIFAFPLSLTVLISSAVRVVFGWTGNRRAASLAALFALPQSVMVVIGNNGLIPKEHYESVIYVTLALTVVSLFFWWQTVVRAGKERYWFEPLLFIAVTLWLILSVNSWIAH